MGENIYILPDSEILRRIGRKVQELRLRQNLTQLSLAEQSQISVSTVKKIENGNIGSFDSIIRVLRILGKLDIFSTLLEKETLSPNEYYQIIEASKKNRRKRATQNTIKNLANNQEDTEW